MNELYLMNLNNIKSYAESLEVDEREGRIFDMLAAISIAWVKSLDGVVADYIKICMESLETCEGEIDG